MTRVQISHVQVSSSQGRRAGGGEGSLSIGGCDVGALLRRRDFEAAEVDVGTWLRRRDFEAAEVDDAFGLGFDAGSYSLLGVYVEV